MERRRIVSLSSRKVTPEAGTDGRNPTDALAQLPKTTAVLRGGERGQNDGKDICLSAEREIAGDRFRGLITGIAAARHHGRHHRWTALGVGGTSCIAQTKEAMLCVHSISPLYRSTIGFDRMFSMLDQPRWRGKLRSRGRPAPE
jgi:hypothetical protein